MKIANNALESCSSIEQVVVLINDEFSSDATAEEIAAAYALSAMDPDSPDQIAEIEAGLDAIAEAGAKFDFATALELATSVVDEEVYRGQCNRCGLVGDWTANQTVCPHCGRVAQFEAIR